MRQIRGYVRTAFERRVGMSMLDWLAAHGGAMTCVEAARHIGYARAHALDGIVRAHLPDFRFARQQSRYTQEQLAEVLAIKVSGKQWAELQAEYGHHIRWAVKRYRDRLRK